MATLEELVVSLVAETHGLRTELNNAAKVTGAASEKMDKAIEEFAANSSKNMNFFQTAMATGIGFLGSQAVLGAFSALKDAAVGLFNTLITEGVSSSMEHERAMIALNKQLALSGEYTREASEGFEVWSDGVERATNLSAEQALELARLAQTYGFSAEASKGAAQAAIDFGAAAGISTTEAVRRLGRTMTGSIADVSKFAPEIANLTKEQLAAGKAAEILGDKFRGSGNALKNYEGTLGAIEHSYGSFTEVLGDSVVKNQAVVNVLIAVNEIIQELTKDVGEADSGMREWVANGVIFAADSLGYMAIALDTLLFPFRSLIAMVETAGKALAAFAAASVEALQGNFGNAMDIMGQLADETAETYTELAKPVAAFEFMTDASIKMGDAAREGLAEVKKGVEMLEEPTNTATDSVKKLTEAEKARQELLKTFAEELSANATSLEGQYAYELELLQGSLDMQLVSLDSFFVEKEELLIEKMEAERAMLEEARAQGLVDEQTYKDAQTALAQKQALEEQKIIQDKLKVEQAKQKEKEQNFASTMSTISSLASSSSKELAAIGKGAAIYQATVDGYAAVQKALASAPPPFNFALAATVGVATAANIAKIAGVGLNKGGTLMGGGANADSVPANLTKGETVISRDLTDKLANALNGGGLGGQVVRIELSWRDGGPAALTEFLEAQILERQSIGISLLKPAGA